MKKIIFVTLTIFVSIIIAACLLAPSEALPMNNPADPQNPENFRSVTIVISGDESGEGWRRASLRLLRAQRLS